jgi:hypothetical protein
MFPYKQSPETFKLENGYTIQDVWYPRVTKIISIKSKPVLYKYYAQVGGYENGQRIAEESAKEGTAVHEAVQSIMVGGTPDVAESIRPSIDAFREYIQKIPIVTRPEYIERRFLHTTHRYAGTIDALAEINGKFGVLDIKTSQGIYRDYNLQTAAYMDPLLSEFPHIETRWILRIDQHQICATCQGIRRIKGGRESIKSTVGKYGLFARCGVHRWLSPIGVVELQEFSNWRDDFETFLAAKKLWEWEHKDMLVAIGYLS